MGKADLQQEYVIGKGEILLHYGTVLQLFASLE